jgi:hypothetical protein
MYLNEQYFPLPFESVELEDVGGGWLLTFRCGGRVFGSVASSVFPSLRNLLLCTHDLAAGRDSISCRWVGEPHGVFLDVTRASETTAHVVIHEMDTRSEGDPAWRPVRGYPVLVTSAPVTLLLSQLTGALRALHAAETQRPPQRRPSQIDLSVLAETEKLLSRMNV